MSGPIYMPCCRVCLNGPLTDAAELEQGVCSDHFTGTWEPQWATFARGQERARIIAIIEAQDRYEVTDSDGFVQRGLHMRKHPEGRLIGRRVLLEALDVRVAPPAATGEEP